MKKFLILFFLLAANVLSVAQRPENQPTQPSDSAYDVQDNVLIKTRDGADISAIVVRNTGITQTIPAILFYTTYIGNRDDSIGKKAVDKGYVGIVAYARGVRTNLDAYMPYEHDGNDIYDIIDWISKQSWCNGKVGMYGGSYTGFSQWSTLRNPHPALKTIVPQAAVMPGYDTPMVNNVCASILCLAWPNAILNYKPLSQDLYQRWYQAGTAYRSLDTFAGQPNRIFQKWLQHPAYDNYWEALVPSSKEYARLNIPVLTTTGYYDDAQIGAMKYLKEHYKNNPKADHYLVIGPYNHRGSQRNAPANLMGYQIDDAAYFNMEDIVFQWLDYVLKGRNKPELLKDKINYEVMGTNEWRHASSLATMSNGMLTFYLSDRNTLESRLLSPQKPQKINFLKQTVDFADRNNQNNYFTPVIINDSLDASNGLTFMTEPFAETFSINGSFLGQINASINKRDMDISIVLYELMPNGKYFYLTRFLG